MDTTRHLTRHLTRHNRLQDAVNSGPLLAPIACDVAVSDEFRAPPLDRAQAGPEMPRDPRLAGEKRAFVTEDKSVD